MVCPVQNSSFYLNCADYRKKETLLGDVGQIVMKDGKAGQMPQLEGGGPGSSWSRPSKFILCSRDIWDAHLVRLYPLAQLIGPGVNT